MLAFMRRFIEIGGLRTKRSPWTHPSTRVASQKVALSAFGKIRMKRVDKDIDKNNKQ
jgi:hypothetical protein